MREEDISEPQRSSTKAYSAEELALGNFVTKRFRLFCVIAFSICLIIALFILFSVPWETRMPYDARYNRAGTGIPKQIAMLPCLIVLFGLWRAGKKSDAHHMGKGGRMTVNIFGSINDTRVCNRPVDYGLRSS